MAAREARIVDSVTHLEVTPKGARRVADIVRAGAAILLEEGFTSLTKRRIAKRLGISHGNVSYYFPTREALWKAVIDNHYDGLKDHAHDPAAHVDEFLTRWIEEFHDRELRIFFAQVLAFAEVNASVARLRDEIYEEFLREAVEIVSPLIADVATAEVEQRVLGVMAMLEGLQAVTAFRPELLSDGGAFKLQVRRTVRAIIGGETPG
jgi:AcrR family transcriptional regulator